MRRHRNTETESWKLYAQVGRGRLMFAEHDGNLWVTNSYWLMPATDAFKGLLALFNLPLEPMVCDAGRSIVRNGSEPPEIGPIINKARKQRKAIQPALVHGSRVLIDSPYFGRTAEVWNGLSEPLAVNPDFRRFVEQHTDADAWKGKDKTSPLAAFRERKFVGCLMPIRISEGTTDLIFDEPTEAAA